MATDWRTTTLGEVTAWMSGGTPDKANRDYWGGEIPWVSAVSMKTIRLNRAESNITESGLRAGSRLAEKGSVLLLVRGSELHKRIPVGMTERAMAFNQDVKSLRAREGLLPEFLLYWLLASEPTLMANVENTGIGAGRLDTDVLKRLPMRLPDPHEQRAIADILGALDDKIELNRRMNETLEAMARARFKAWFVDFDPVRAKAEGRDPSLPKPIADLFPDSFEQSELGKTPTGWRLGAFSDVTDVIRETVDPRALPAVTFNHYSIPAFDKDQTPKRELGEAIRSNKWRVLPDTVLVSKLNPEIERVWLTNTRGDHNLCSTEFVVLRGRRPYGRAFLYGLARSSPFRGQLAGLVTGTSKSHQRAQVGNILALRVTLPPASVVEAFEMLTWPFLARTLSARDDSVTLAQVRDALLPKLISGEIRVPQAERLIEAAPA